MIAEMEQLKYKTQQSEQNSLQLTHHSENKEIQKLVETINSLLADIQKKEEALHIKHEVVTELNGIGTWDAEFKDGELNKENKNIYNDIFRESLGYKNEKDFPNVLDSWYNTVSDLDMARVTEAYEKHLFGSDPYDIEYRSIKKDGSIEWVHTRAKALKDENGKVYRHVGTQMNIHESKMNSLKVQQLLSKLDLMEKSLSFSVKTLEGAWGMNLKKEESVEQESWFSPQFKRLLGFDGDDYFEPKIETWLNMISVTERETTSRNFNAHLSDNTGRTEFNMKFRMRTKNAEYRWFSMVTKTIRDQAGNPTLVSGVLRDINHEIKRQEDDERIEKNMNDFMQSLGELADNIKDISREATELAHENEVTVSFAQKAKDCIESTKAVTELIKQISSQTNLLGLNASIEAARAGEHGKGFGVVAEEVQKLSTHTAKAVEQIEQILEDINQSVLKIVSSIDTMSNKIQTQAAVTEEINNTTENINDMSAQLLVLLQNLD